MINLIRKHITGLDPEITRDITGAYEDYVTRISLPDMACSLESALALLGICRALEPARVVDLGSGFSSFVLRHLKSRLAPSLEVYSVDTDPKWLDRSRDFCAAAGLDETNFMLWPEFEKSEPGRFDLALLDIEDSPRRQGYLPGFISKYTAPMGAVMIDDMHWPNYRRDILETLAGHDHYYLNLKPETLDSYGRYAALAIQVAPAPGN